MQVYEYTSFQQIYDEAKKAVDQFDALNHYIAIQKEVDPNNKELLEIEKNLLDGESSLHYRTMVALGDLALDNSLKTEDQEAAMKTLIKTQLKDTDLVQYLDANSIALMGAFSQQLVIATEKFNSILNEGRDALDSWKHEQNPDQYRYYKSLGDRLTVIPKTIKDFVHNVTDIVKTAGAHTFEKVYAAGVTLNVLIADHDKDHLQSKLNLLNIRLNRINSKIDHSARMLDAKINLQQKLFNAMYPGQFFDTSKVKDKTLFPRIASLKHRQIALQKEINNLQKEIVKIEIFQRESMAKLGKTYGSVKHDYVLPITIDLRQQQINEKLKEKGIKPVEYKMDSASEKEVTAKEIKYFDCSDPNRYEQQIDAFENALSVLNSQSQIESLTDPALTTTQILLATELYLKGYRTEQVEQLVLNSDFTQEKAEQIYAKFEKELQAKDEKINAQSTRLDELNKFMENSSDLDVVQQAINHVRQETLKSLKDPLVDITTDKPYINYLFTIDEEIAYEGLDILTKNGIKDEDINKAGNKYSFATMDQKAMDNISQFLKEHQIHYNLDVAVEIELTHNFEQDQDTKKPEDKDTRSYDEGEER